MSTLLAQSVSVQFTARSTNGQYHSFDSVLVENVTRGWIQRIAYPDTAIVLGPSEAINVAEAINNVALKVYPNPFAGTTSTTMQLNEDDEVSISILRIDGSVVSEYKSFMNSGVYVLNICLAEPQVAFLSVSTRSGRSVAKLVNTKAGSSNNIEVLHQGNANTKDVEIGPFNVGDQMIYTAVSITDGERTLSNPLIQVQAISELVTLLFDDDIPSVGGFDQNGASNAVFSVAEGRTVHFSSGNLQYQASTDTWRFAEHQYDYVGSTNSNISLSNSDWIDLFGWGTSGWNSGANAYQPWATSTNYWDYYPGSSYTYDLTGTYANADWGVYSAISNGGNQTGMWRTLTKDEWSYLLNSRAASTVSGVANARYAKAVVNGTNGVVVFPDNFTMPSGMSYPSDINTSSAPFNNTYTESQWNQMEDAGCIFFPAAGYRDGTEVGSVGAYGGYWSSTYDDGFDAYIMDFNVDGLYVYGNRRNYGRSVRLVRD